MKYVYIFFIILLLAFNSCTDTDNTGDIYGQWQLTSISDNGQEISSPKSLFLAFQGEIVKARIADQENYNYTYVPGKFTEQNDSLILSFYIEYQISKQHLEKDYMMEGDLANQRFEYTVTSDKIILRRGIRQWNLRKY